MLEPRKSVNPVVVNLAIDERPLARKPAAA
jgi:hypothetical protein